MGFYINAIGKMANIAVSRIKREFKEVIKSEEVIITTFLQKFVVQLMMIFLFD